MTDKAVDFVHLHVHTQYSLLDGAIRIDRLLKRVADFDMDAVAITDHGTMFGALTFYEQANNAGIKPIIGCECYLLQEALKIKLRWIKVDFHISSFWLKIGKAIAIFANYAPLPNLKDFITNPASTKKY